MRRLGLYLLVCSPVYSLPMTWTKGPLKGIVPPVASPLLVAEQEEQGGAYPRSLDREALRTILDQQIQDGVAGIFLLGTTGEGPTLKYDLLPWELRQELIELSCQVVEGRAVPVLVSIADTCLFESMRTVRFCQEQKVSAVVLPVPNFFASSQEDLLRYVRSTIEQVELPVMLYNLPSALNPVRFEIDTLKELLKEPKIVGIKDSSGDLDYFAQVCKLKELRDDWTVLMGPEHLLVDAVRCGADGGVHGGANVEPSLFVELYKAVRDGDDSRIEQYQRRLQAFQEIYKVRPGFSVVEATKCAMQVRGLCHKTMAPGLIEFNDEEEAKVKAILDTLPMVD